MLLEGVTFRGKKLQRWNKAVLLLIPGYMFHFAPKFHMNIKKRTETLYQSFSPFMGMVVIMDTLLGNRLENVPLL